MTNAMAWGTAGEKTYETGVDKGVLYLSDGIGVPWNGLTSVIEKFDKKSAPVYYDGIKISELVSLGSFSASMSAFTYPDEFLELEGVSNLRHGVFAGDQRSRSFGLCYRTKVANDLNKDAGYKIHILYNVTAIPDDKDYETINEDIEPMEFEWDIVAIPEEVPGIRPTAHFIVDSRETDPILMKELEDLLYGTSLSKGRLLPLSELVDHLKTWCRYKITDNGDGTWTATSAADELIVFDEEEEGIFTLLGINVVYLDNDGLIQISDTCDINDVYKINIVDNGDGTWIASAEDESYISVDSENRFEIYDVEANFIAEETYVVSSTPY